MILISGLILMGQASGERPAPNPPQIIELWPGKPPGDVGISGEEKFIELKVAGKPYEVGGKPTRWLTNVSHPTLTVFPAPQEKNTGLAMLICPGGGYHNLGWDVEGEEVAGWLNSVGITGILLKYRCPRRPGDVKGEPPAGPLKDAQRAISLVRSRADQWGVDPGKIGMVGFSAGGHLVGSTATNFAQRTYDAVDEVDQISCRPDFAISLYSGYFKTRDGLSPTVRADPGTPPVLIFHASDDPISDVEHSVTYYLAMRRAGVPAELHVYATGGHGWGVRKLDFPCASWTDRTIDWLRERRILK